jgi:PIN domain nuclease of toxin-antitoxin system
MKYLLDTHTYLWYRTAPAALPGSVLTLLTDASHEMLISIATPWELAIKTGSGKLHVTSLLIDFDNRETAAGFVMTDITTTQAISSGLLPPHHRDPFDRILAAQALDLRIPLISRDSVFDLYGVQRIWS